MEYDRENDRYTLADGNDDLIIYPDGLCFREKVQGVEIYFKQSDCLMCLPLEYLNDLIDGLSQARQKLVANGQMKYANEVKP